MTIYKVNSQSTVSSKISDINNMVIELEGLIEQAKFNLTEIAHLYSGSGLSRKFKRNVSLGHDLTGDEVYSGWSHLQAESGYSIFKYSPSNYTYNAENQLYFDNKILTNKGNASAETAETFDIAYLYDGAAYITNTTEAGTEGGTAFNLMDATGEYLYVGHSTTFKGVKLEFGTRGSNYDLIPEIFTSGASAYTWSGLTSEVDGLVDNTSDFESDGAITWNLDSTTGAGWLQNSVNSNTKYWMRIKTITTPVTTATANYIIPATSVIGLLALSSSEILNENWTWCTYSTDIYVTIRNTGNSAYEGDYYLTSSSSDTNKQNYFVYNHEFSADYQDSAYTDTDNENLITKVVVISPFNFDEDLTTGNGKIYFAVPNEMNGKRLVSANAHVYTVSTLNSVSIAIYNNTTAQDMLSTNITIDINEKDSATAVIPAVINTAYDTVSTGDELRIDVDGAGTGTKGLEVRLGFRAVI